MVYTKGKRVQIITTSPEPKKEANIPEIIYALTINLLNIVYYINIINTILNTYTTT